MNSPYRQITLLSVLVYLLSFPVLAQPLPLFDNERLLDMVDRGGDYIYNQQFDSADMVIDSIEARLPEHPIVPMMKAMRLAWEDQPIRSSSPIFEAHEKYLRETIALAEVLEDKDGDNLEAIFFKMSAHGLLAEYYAQEGSTFKAIGQAKQTYNLIKKTMEHTDESPELLFLVGLYNYFREKYPERHPIYKSFLWIFKSGDIEKGLEQLDHAVHQSKIVKIEASLYLSYIWLRYENRSDKAEYYLGRLYKMYPANNYFKAKYLECLMRQKNYESAYTLIDQLRKNSEPYFAMCGEIFYGAYLERVSNDLDEAKKSYQQGLAIGRQDLDRGEYYRAVAYLGLGRIAETRGDMVLAEKYYKKTVDLDETDWMTEEGEVALKRID